MKTVTINGIEFKDGDKVTCTIADTVINDAKISINDRGDLYICQNHKDGDYVDDRKGYKYSWYYDSNVKDLRFPDYEIF